jgi:hypothetical protein
VWGDGSISAEEVIEEFDCGWRRQREKLVGTSDGISAGAAVAENMSSGVSVVRAEPTTLVVSVCPRVRKEHVVGHRGSNKLSVARDPGGKTRVVAKESTGVSRGETHGSTFLINVIAVCSVEEA